MHVLITPRGFATSGQKEIQRMRALGFTVDYNNTGQVYDAATFLDKARDADGIIVGVDDMSRPVLEQLPKLKAICKYGVGIDNIDLSWCEAHNIAVGRTVGSNSLSVAEHTLALILCDAKLLFPSLRNVKDDGGWDRRATFEVAGKTIGIIGFGAIGKLLSQLCSAIGMHVLACDIAPIGEEVAAQHGAHIADFDEILETADYISLHVPLLDSTRNLIGAPEIAKMRSNACIVNCARGGVVDEAALYDALRHRTIRSACFDTFSSEPPAADTPLLKLDNFLLTPHMASRTKEADERTCQIAAQFILEHLESHTQ